MSLLSVDKSATNSPSLHADTCSATIKIVCKSLNNKTILVQIDLQ